MSSTELSSPVVDGRTIKQNNPFGIIPTDVWKNILSYLEGSSKSTISLLGTDSWCRKNCFFSHVSLEDKYVTNTGIRTIVGIKGLESIDLSHSKNVTAGIIEILASAPRLTSLALCGFDLTEQWSILNALVSIKSLNTLDLSNTNINDDDLLFIVSKLPHLVNIHLYWCNGITAKGIIQMAGYCEQLKYLGLEGCAFTYEEESDIYSAFLSKGVHIDFEPEDYVGSHY